ncbi:major facilitator family transporter [Novosphingobium sp. Rr 2-17]|uniref:MFS transporter n=1 Tax=Novosphingobium sp. Rr 2-17 TaxID=555793 RepID=UPI0002697B95|nr:MFS transporter [Novosphingobium sp. Rr 2-17]EIZ78321.1 major facilitator family transporter [Novosphingobium sp. Rr 2-17]
MPETSPVFSPFRGRFCVVWLLRGCSALAGQIFAFALALQLFQKSGSTLDLGLLGLIQFFPSLVLALPAGHLVDRFAPGRVAMVVQVANALAAGLLLLAPGLPPEAMLPALFAGALVTGGTRAFEHPINTALLPSVVADRDVARAVAWTMTVAKIATLVGPVLGGALYAFGPQVAYGAALVLFGASGLLAAALGAVGLSQSKPALELRSALAGVGVIWRDRVLSGAMVLDMLAVLLGGAMALLPVYAMVILHTGSVGLGILRAAPGLGAVVTGLWLARHPVDRSAGQILLVSTAIFGLSTCGFGISKSYELTLAMLTIMGAADMVSIHIRSALIQLRTPPELRGRVGAVNGIFISSSNQIGAFESGLTAYWFGTVPAVVFGGLATIAVTGLVATGFTALRRADHIDRKPHPA